MTCVVGLVHDGKVYLGADSAGVNGYSVTVRADEKVFTNGAFTIGFAGSFRLGQLLRYSLKPPARSPCDDVREYMATRFVDAVRECLKNGGYACRENDQEVVGGEFLVGHAGQLLHVDSAYSVGIAMDGFAAMGEGEEVALGSLFSTRTRDLDAHQRLHLALSAAEHFNGAVRRPFLIRSQAREAE